MPEKEQQSKMNNPTLPITIPYQDKLELAYMLLHTYSKTVQNLTPRNIDILAVAIVFDVNDKNFKEILMESNLGFKTDSNVKTEMSRLKKINMIVPHAVYNRKVLHPHIELFKQLVNSKSDEVCLSITFKRNGTK